VVANKQTNRQTDKQTDKQKQMNKQTNAGIYLAEIINRMITGKPLFGCNAYHITLRT